METIIVLDDNNVYKPVFKKDAKFYSDDFQFVAFYTPSGKQNVFASHWHFDYEIMLPLTGYIDIVINNKDYRMCPGEAILIDSQDLHGHKDSFTREYGDYISFVFDINFLFPDNTSLIYKNVFEKMHSGEKTFTKHVLGKKKYEQKIVSNLMDIYSYINNFAANAFTIQLKLLEIFNILYKEDAFENKSLFSNKNVIMNAVKYIHQYYDTQILVSDIAKELNFSSDHFTKLFKEHMKMSPKEYLLNRRLLVFTRVIRSNPGSSISETATLCGFTDPNYFARVFKKKLGITPSEYIKNLKSNTKNSEIVIIK